MKATLYIGNDRFKDVNVNRCTEKIEYAWIKPLESPHLGEFEEEFKFPRMFIFRRVTLDKFRLEDVV